MEVPLLQHNVAEFGTVIDQVALKLQRHLIALAGTNYMEVLTSDRVGFDSPALCAPAPLLGVDLSPLPRLLYTTDVTQQSVFAFWNRDLCAAFLQGDTQEAIAALRAAFPDVRLHGTSMQRAVQFLRLVSWGLPGATSRFTSDTALVNVTSKRGPVTLGFVKDTMKWVVPRDGTQSQRCLPGLLPTRVDDALSLPIGNRHQSKAQTGGVYRKLIEFMPELAAPIQYVFSAAVAGGPEFQDRLLSPFDWVLVRDPYDTHEDVWRQATQIIQNATLTPLPELYRLLRARIGHDVFYDHFGNPHRDPGTYRPTTRARHLKTITDLKQRSVGTTSPATAAHELIELQRLIGGSHV